MKKKTVALLLTAAMAASALGAAGCGKQLALTSDKVSDKSEIFTPGNATSRDLVFT